MNLRLLKFDTINPQIYLDKKIEENKELIEKMSRKELLEWIISTRGNFSDFYTYNLNKLSWESEEFFTNDHYIDKVANEVYGSGKKYKYFIQAIRDKIHPVKDRTKLNVIHAYVKKYKPDVILVREQTGIPSHFWKSFDSRTLLVSRLAAPVPRHWYPSDWDLILSSTEAYKTFFELNGVPTYINQNGFDERVLKELKEEGKKYEVTFAGGLGDKFWMKRTECFEYVAENLDFKWWGYNYNKKSIENNLNKAWQGLTSGLEMLQIYKNSKIVLNDYGEIAGGVGVNQRLFEALGVGTFLLTRYSDNLKRQYPANIFMTYNDEKDCVDKAKYFLCNDKEREEIALAGQKFVLENYNYKILMKELSKILEESYKKKFNSNGREHKIQ